MRQEHKKASVNALLLKEDEKSIQFLRWKRRVDLLTNIPLSSDAKILELCCGTGLYSGEIAKIFPDLVAIDSDERALSEARRHYPKIHFVQSHSQSVIPFYDETFDGVLGEGVLNQIDYEKTLNQVYNKLKKGGWICFSEKNGLNPLRLFKKPLFLPGQLQRALERAGFRNIKIETYDFLHPSLPHVWVGLIEKAEAALMKTQLRLMASSLKVLAQK